MQPLSTKRITFPVNSMYRRLPRQSLITPITTFYQTRNLKMALRIIDINNYHRNAFTLKTTPFYITYISLSTYVSNYFKLKANHAYIQHHTTITFAYLFVPTPLNKIEFSKHILEAREELPTIYILYIPQETAGR